MLHLYRFIVHLCTFLFVCLPLMVLGVLVLPLAIWLAGDNIRLHNIFKWWDNVDSYIGRDTSVYRIICDNGFWTRFNWLALRNPINYFGYIHMGMLWKGYEVYTRYNPADNDVGDGSRAGFRHIEVDKAGTKYFEYYWIYQYPFKKNVCFRYRLGWKISNKNNTKGSISQWVMVISPWHNFTGK